MRKRVFLFASVLAIVVVAVFGGPALAGRPGTGTVREATLTGTEVVPQPGDPDGTGLARLTLYPNKHKICYRITVSGIAPATAAHLHRAPAGQNGPVKLGLLPPRDESSRECIRGLDEGFIRRIGRNSSGYYVDVHNRAFPAGAVRGQLSR